MFGLEKRWHFKAIVTDQALVSAAVANFGYMGYGFAYVWDRENGQLRKFQQITPLGLGAQVAYEPDDGFSRFSTPAGMLKIDPERDTLEIVAADWQASVKFEPDAKPFDAAWRIPGAGRHRTRKRMGQRAAGTLRLPDRELVLEGLGLEDWSRGFLARETAWCWAAGAGRAGERTVAWNLRTGFDDPTGAENAIWVDGTPLHPGIATIEPGGAWRVAAGPLELMFEPDGEHREDLDYMLVASRYTQPWGRFVGTLEGVPIVGYGVVEDHWARW